MSQQIQANPFVIPVLALEGGTAWRNIRGFETNLTCKNLPEYAPGTWQGNYWGEVATCEASLADYTGLHVLQDKMRQEGPYVRLSEVREGLACSQTWKVFQGLEFVVIYAEDEFPSGLTTSFKMFRIAQGPMLTALENHEQGKGMQISLATRRLAKFWHDQTRQEGGLSTPQPLSCEERFQKFLNGMRIRTLGFAIAKELELQMIEIFEGIAEAYKTDFLVDMLNAGLDRSGNPCRPEEQLRYWLPNRCGSFMFAEKDKHHAKDQRLLGEKALCKLYYLSDTEVCCGECQKPLERNPISGKLECFVHV